MRYFLLVLFLAGYAAAIADSTLSFDLPKDYIEKRNKKRLLLSIKIPSELTSDEEFITKKKVDTSHIELDPFARNTKPVDFEKLRMLCKKGLITGSSQHMLFNGGLENRYDICNMLAQIHDKMFRLDKEDLIEMGITKDDIFFLEAMYNQFSEELASFVYLDVPSLMDRFKLLKKQLRGGRGDVRVVEVQEEADGSTILYLTLQEER